MKPSHLKLVHSRPAPPPQQPRQFMDDEWDTRVCTPEQERNAELYEAACAAHFARQDARPARRSKGDR